MIRIIKESDSILAPKARIEWIDFAKGLSILLTIVGHSLFSGFFACTLRGIIYSFHMPLFFILGAMTYHFSSNVDEFKSQTIRAAKHLLFPAVGVWVIVIVFDCICSPNSATEFSFWKDKFVSLIFASGVAVTENQTEIGAIGIIWFVFAFFIARTMFDYIKLTVGNISKCFLMSMIFCLLGIILGKVQWLPFSADIAFAVLPFVFFGYYIKNRQMSDHSIKRLIFWAIIWLSMLGIEFLSCHSYMELAMRRYALPPISYFAAIAGSMTVCYFSISFCKLGKAAKPLVFLGKNSLSLLCIHSLDFLFQNIWIDENSKVLLILKRMFWNLLIWGIYLLLTKVIKSIVRKHRN